MTRTLCQICAIRERATLLTGYCIEGRCELCGRKAKVAITKKEIQ